MREDLIILLTSAGRRVELLRCFREDASTLGVDLRLLATDVRPHLSAACCEADHSFAVPPSDHPEFPCAIAELCQRQGVRLIVPTNDLDLTPLSTIADQLKAAGAWVPVGTPEAIEIARDKLKTAEFLENVGIPTPNTALAENAARSFPLGSVLAKPRFGSASQGVYRLSSVQDLRARSLANYIVQEIVEGTEFTTNVYIAVKGSVYAAVPHRRIEVRAGEVSKAITVEYSQLCEYAAVIARELPLQGPLCFQAIGSEREDPKVIEINARFGGGYPVAHRAGAHFTRYLIEQALGREPTPSTRWQPGLLMLRYDAAFYVEP